MEKIKLADEGRTCNQIRFDLKRKCVAREILWRKYSIYRRSVKCLRNVLEKEVFLSNSTTISNVCLMSSWKIGRNGWLLNCCWVKKVQDCQQNVFFYISNNLCCIFVAGECLFALVLGVEKEKRTELWRTVFGVIEWRKIDHLFRFFSMTDLLHC